MTLGVKVLFNSTISSVENLPTIDITPLAYACQMAAQAFEAEAEAFVREDQVEAERQAEIGTAWSMSRLAFYFNVYAKNEGDDLTAAAYQKASQAYEKQAVALERGSKGSVSEKKGNCTIS